jgi:hypothetical protein
MGVDMTEKEANELAGAFLGPQVEDIGRLLYYCYPFEEQIIKLQERLRNWRPRTVLEMRYAGYGGVDPVGLYAFYFASIIGMATIIGLGISVAQTYATFKALKPGI